MPAGAAGIDEQGQERLAVGLRVERAPPIAFERGDLVEITREVVEALGSHEEAVGDFRKPRQPQRAGQIAGVIATANVMIAPTALGVEAAAGRHGLQQRRLPAAVLPHEKRHVRPQLELEAVAERGDVERMPSRLDLLRQERDPSQERTAASRDRARASSRDGGSLAYTPARLSTAAMFSAAGLRAPLSTSCMTSTVAAETGVGTFFSRPFATTWPFM